MVNSKELTVHSLCRKYYTRLISSIKASTRPEVGEPPPKVPSLRPQEYKLHYKNTVYFVTRYLKVEEDR